MKFYFQIRETAKIPNQQFADHLEYFFKDPSSKQLLTIVKRTNLAGRQRALRLSKFQDG